MVAIDVVVCVVGVCLNDSSLNGPLEVGVLYLVWDLCLQVLCVVDTLS